MTNTDVLMMNCNTMSESMINNERESTKPTVLHVEVLPSPRLPQDACDRDAPVPTPVKQVRRTRKTHTKARTGCLTCKIRRKKCDETKPACLRCTGTGRKCDGYAAPPPLPPSAQSTTPASPGATFVFNSTTTPADLTDVSDNARPVIIEIDDTVPEEDLEAFILSYNSTSKKPASSCPNAVVYQQEPPVFTLRTNEGYNIPPTTDRVVAVLPRTPNFFAPNEQITDLEAHCFSHFRHRTGPAFASYFDSSIWRSYAIRGALAHPVVFAAAAALGCVHRRFNYGISPLAFEYCAHAARLQAKAVKALNDLKAEHINHELVGSSSMGGGGGMGVYDRDVIMTSEMLLGLFEAFQGEYGKSVDHINNGLKHLLNRPMALVHSESRYCIVESTPNVFCQLLHRLHCRALQLFKSPPKILVKQNDGVLLPTVPNAFESLEQARDYIFTEADWIMHAPVKGWRNKHERSIAQKLHVGRLLKWSVAYANTVAVVDRERTAVEKRCSMVLKLTRSVTYLLLSLTLFVNSDETLQPMPNMTEILDDDIEQDPALVYATNKSREAMQERDALNQNLARVTVLADTTLDENGIFHYDEHSVSFDSAIGPPKYADKLPESSAKTRHRIQYTLKKDVDDAALWEMLGVYGVAERVSAVEEHAVIESVRNIIPNHVDPKWIDITVMMENRRILLRYCRPDDYGLGMMWTQEWWTF